MNNNNFFLLAGPCVVESEENCLLVADTLCRITRKLQIPFTFKASYRKDNRSRGDSFIGIGDRKALEILQHIKKQYQVPVVTDIHLPEEAGLAASYDIDILQIPAFMCRQTSLLQAAAETGKKVNVKKGQFLAPDQMRFVIDKLLQFGCAKGNIMITERGTQFGYNDLIVDMRGLTRMKDFSVPVVLDVTHSLQQPNQSSGVTGGQPSMVRTLATAGVALGVDGLFIETHPNPSKALSDGANMLPLDQMEALLTYLLPFRETYLQANK